MAVALVVSALAAEEKEVVPSIEQEQEDTSDNTKDLQTAEGHLGIYGGHRVGLGHANGLYATGYGGYGHGIGYGTYAFGGR